MSQFVTTFAETTAQMARSRELQFTLAPLIVEPVAASAMCLGLAR